MLNTACPTAGGLNDGGGVAGWLASLLMRRDASQGVVLNIVVGIIGSFLGGWLLPRLGVNSGGGWAGFLATAFIGTVVLLLVVNLVARGRAR